MEPSVRTSCEVTESLLTHSMIRSSISYSRQVTPKGSVIWIHIRMCKNIEHLVTIPRTSESTKVHYSLELPCAKRKAKT